MTRRPTLALLLAALLAACSGDDGEGGPASAPGDADGDGLSDTGEATWGTSPLLADTDGDGYGDLEELVQYGFDPLNNNYKFNPLVSDLPRLGVTFTTMPKVTLLFGQGTSSSREFSTAHERGLSQSQTTSRSTSNSVASEFSQSVGAEVSASVEVGTGGVSGSASVTASYNATWSTTTEQTVSFGSEQTQESSETWTEGQAYATSNDVSFSGGTLAIAANVVNEGNLAFELRSLALGVVAVSPSGERTLDPVGNLVYDGGDFPPMTLGPGQSSTALVFTKDDLDLGTAQALLADSTGLMVKISSYELADRGGLGFNHRLTEVSARTAQVVIDYAGIEDRPVERYNVATNADPANLRITARRALEILRIPYAVDGAGRLAAVRALANDAGRKRAWHVVHVTTDGLAQHVETLRETDAYTFETLPLKSGDVLHLVLMEDADGDGIGVRQEFVYGTRDDSGDLDADGLSDRDEAILYGLNPQRPDTDLDGKRDSAEVFSSISMGPFHALAVAVDGTLWKWGISEWGQAGNCGGVFSTSCNVLPARIELPDARRVAAAAAGSFRSFAIAEDGSLWAWGLNGLGQLGVGDVTNRTAPARVGSGTSWAKVASGELHVLGLTTDGTLYGWGSGANGQLGAAPETLGFCGAQRCAWSPLQIGAAGEWAEVWAGGQVSMGVKKDGTLWAWGLPNYGQLGLGPMNTLPLLVSTPTRVGTGSDWRTGALGLYTAYAVKADGSLWSWGMDTEGQLGHDGSSTCAQKPCSVVPERIGASNDWASVAAGWVSVVALRTNQSAWTFGLNDWGQAGYGVTGGAFDRPGVLYNLRWRQVSAGGNSVGGLDRAFRLRAWGQNDAGQLGVGDVALRNAPTPVKQ